MAKVLVEESNLQNIANTIRAKNKTTIKYTPSQMSNAIAELSNLPDVTPSDDGKILKVINGVWSTGDSVVIDSVLSNTSTNPVQNKTVKAALDEKQKILVAGQNITISGNTISADVDPTEIASNVTDWLEENVDPVGSAVVVDSTLSIKGAAADAKVTGDEISGVKSAFTVNRTVIDKLVSTDDILVATNEMVDTSWYISLNTGTLTASGTSQTRSVAIPCEIPGTYILTKKSSAYFRYGFIITEPVIGAIVYNINRLTTETSAALIVDDPSVKYIVITYLINDTTGDDAIRDSIFIYNQDITAKDSVARELISSQNFDISMIKQSMPDGVFDKITAVYDPHFESGGISNEDGSDTQSSYRIRTGFIKVGEEVVATNSGSDVCWIRAYGEANQDSFIGNYIADSNGNLMAGTTAKAYGFSVDSILLVNPNVKYIRVVERKDPDRTIIPAETTFSYTYKAKVLNGAPLSDVFYSKEKGAYSQSDIPLQYYIDNDNHYTKGFLKLPSNYVRTGAPVPLIVFVHGSADFSGLSSSAMTTHYNDYYNYLRDCGYAIFDCYGFGSEYPVETNTWGIPLNDKCYLSGIHYVCEKYNVDKDNIFVCCKSLGGLQAFNMLLSPDYNVKAVAMLAPELWELNMTFGYSAAQRQIIATDLGFSEDTDGVMNFNQGDPIPEGFYDYVTENMDKWNGIFPNFRGLPILPANKPNYYNNTTGTETMFRNSLSRPVKIWIAQDDEAVSYNKASAVISSLKNAGCNATLRTMPNNAGGHHSVDTDANAPQTANVTTRLGITYATIPTAYYEVGQFFDEFMSK